MDKEKKPQTSNHSQDPDKDSVESGTSFNAGGNNSDYDGGHPEDALAQEHKNNEKQQEHSTDESFNAGGNDSDYDGGHPEDAKPESEGHISSKDKN